MIDLRDLTLLNKKCASPARVAFREPPGAPTHSPASIVFCCFVRAGNPPITSSISGKAANHCLGAYGVIGFQKLRVPRDSRTHLRVLFSGRQLGSVQVKLIGLGWVKTVESVLGRAYCLLYEPETSMSTSSAFTTIQTATRVTPGTVHEQHREWVHSHKGQSGQGHEVFHEILELARSLFFLSKLCSPFRECP